MANVLVCDDEMELCEILSDWLGMQEHACTIVTDPTKVVSELSKKMYSLVILDYQMPGMSGKEVLESIRKVFTPTELPVVFLTGHGAKDIVVEVAKSGISGFFVKPLDFVAMAKNLPLLLAKKMVMEDVRGLMSKCIMSDPSLSKESGLEQYASRPNALFAANFAGKKVVLCSQDSTKSLKDHKSWSEKDVLKITIIYSFQFGRWHRLWPTFWDK